MAPADSLARLRKALIDRAARREAPVTQLFWEAGAQAMMASPSPADAAAMERHGVIPPLTVYVEK